MLCIETSLRALKSGHIPPEGVHICASRLPLGPHYLPAGLAPCIQLAPEQQRVMLGSTYRTPGTRRASRARLENISWTVSSLPWITAPPTLGHIGRPSIGLARVERQSCARLLPSAPLVKYKMAVHCQQNNEILFQKTCRNV